MRSDQLSHWMRLAARLYPQRWRDRYASEFDALLEDVNPSVTTLVNVVSGALIAQVRYGGVPVRLGVGTALLGALLAGVIAFRIPSEYAATATLRASEGDSTEPAIRETLGMRALASAIERFDLYPAERRREPMEDTVARLRAHLSVTVKPPEALVLNFRYPDALRAQAVVAYWSGQLREQAEANVRAQAVQRDILGRELSARGLANPVPAQQPTQPRFEILDPASTRLIQPVRTRIVLVGTLAAWLTGLIVALAARRPWLSARVLGSALAGFVIAGGASEMVWNRYISSAVLTVSPPLDATAWYGGQAPATASQIAGLAAGSLTPDVIAELGRKWRVDGLTAAAISIQPVGARAIRVGYENRDPRKAQAIVNEVANRLQDAYAGEQRRRASQSNAAVQLMLERGFGDSLRILDAPTLPQAPVWPNRLTIASLGAIGGLLLAWCWSRRNAGYRNVMTSSL